MSIELDEDGPLWLINEQIKGLLEGDGADEDHDSVIKFLLSTGLPETTVKRMHKALVHGDTKVSLDHLYRNKKARLLFWKGPKHIRVPSGGVIARTYSEFSEEDANKPESYWCNGPVLYTHRQLIGLD